MPACPRCGSRLLVSEVYEILCLACGESWEPRGLTRGERQHPPSFGSVDPRTPIHTKEGRLHYTVADPLWEKTMER
jgi:hypothetical protein